MPPSCLQLPLFCWRGCPPKAPSYNPTIAKLHPPAAPSYRPSCGGEAAAQIPPSCPTADARCRPAAPNYRPAARICKKATAKKLLSYRPVASSDRPATSQLAPNWPPLTAQLLRRYSPTAACCRPAAPSCAQLPPSFRPATAELLPSCSSAAPIYRAAARDHCQLPPTCLQLVPDSAAGPDSAELPLNNHLGSDCYSPAAPRSCVQLATSVRDRRLFPRCPQARTQLPPNCRPATAHSFPSTAASRLERQPICRGQLHWRQNPELPPEVPAKSGD